MGEASSPLQYGREPATAKRGRRLARAAVALLIVVASIYVVGKIIGRAMDPRVGRAADAASSPVPGLPSTATSIQYRIGGAFDAEPLTFECNMPEAHFVAWATARGLANRPGAEDTIWTVNGEITIVGGVFFYRSYDADSAEYAAYDRKAGRAYYHTHTR
jgi:hypothetical protein